MNARLPQELIFDIIGFLHNNKAALSACSLSCRTLAAISKPLLFHTLRIHLRFESAARIVPLSEFSPTVFPLVKKIRVVITNFESRGAMTIVAISQFMARCHAQNVSPALDIDIRPTHRSPHQFVKSVLQRLDSVVDWVTSLELDGLDLTRDTQSLDLVLAFRMLKSLGLRRVAVGEGSVYTPSHSELQVSHLSLRESSLGSGPNICWFLINNTMSLPSLTSLDVRFRMMLDQDSVRFGERYGPTVKTLRFGLVTPRSANFLNKALNSTTEFISKFSNLEALTFQGLFVPTIQDMHHLITFQWIPAVLRGVSATIRKFTMEVVTAHPSHLDVIPWPDIDEILARELQSVFIVEIFLATSKLVDRSLENVWQVMSMRLPLAAQRGVLRCSAVADHPS